jgi:hypothetical protein
LSLTIPMSMKLSHISMMVSRTGRYCIPRA